MATLPALSEEGWITEGNSVLYHLISYYILTDAAQTIAFQGNLINLPETYYKFVNDPTGMNSAVRSDLDKLLGRYFANVDIITQTKELTSKKYAILINVIVTDSLGKRYTLTNITEINTAGLRNIINFNNYGDGSDYLTGLN